MDPVALSDAFARLDRASMMAFFACFFTCYWLAHAWILLLSARIFADVDLGWGRSLSTVLLGAMVEGCGACLIGGLVFADGQGVSAMEWLLATLLGWVVWFVALSRLTGLDIKGTFLTAIGMAVLSAAFRIALGWGATLALA